MTAADSHETFLTSQDEMSLDDALRAQTEDSLPDTLEVRTDSFEVLRDSTAPLKRPLLVAAIGLGLVVVGLAVAGAITRARRGGAAA